MSTEKVAPAASQRRPWLAALLNFALPGLGHLYSGDGVRAVSLFLLFPPTQLAIYLLAVIVPVSVANVVIPAALTLAARVLVARDAARAACRIGPAMRVPFFSRSYSWVGVLILIGGLNLAWAFAYRSTLVEAYRIRTGPMRPTILPGDRVLAIKWSYGWREPVFGNVVFNPRQPERGEIVIFRFPEDRSRCFIMRAIGLPGETVEIRQKVVRIDGKPLREPYVEFLEPPVGSGDSLGSYPLGFIREDWGP
jgi:signal peptidase I